MFEKVLGLELAGGWVITAPARKGDTGGFFSVGFIVKRADGVEAFAKLLNYERAARSDDFAGELEKLSRAHRFERDVLTMCAASGLTRVVKVIGSGDLTSPTLPLPVPYIIFERADGDVRMALDALDRGLLAAKLRWCHQAAVAVRQLHSVKVAHQDIKPSNLLVFEAASAGLHESKIGDLGRATSRQHEAEHDTYAIPGALAYAPPEQLYGQIGDEFAIRRYASDLYQLGSLISFIMTMTSMHQRRDQHLDPQFSYANWGDTYMAVLPHIRTAHALAIEDLRTEIGGRLGDDIARIVGYLTEPDPTRRGHPRDRGTVRPFALQRVVSDLNTAAARAAITSSRKPNE